MTSHPTHPTGRQPTELGNNDDEAEDNRPDAEEEIQPIVSPAAVEPTVEPLVLLPRRSQRQGRKKEIVSMLAALDQDEEPNPYRDAIVAQDADDWKIAIDKEYVSLIENNTWELITPPPGHSVIKSRWTFKIKPATRTREKIFKARFVAKGFSQVPGVDYNHDEV